MTRLDIRWPLGFLFTLIGAILVVYGMFTRPSVSGIESINIVWGACLVLFGGVMLALAWRATKVLKDG